jgi:xylulokinase
MLLMGVDVGTTGAKAAVFTPEGELKGYGFREYGVISERPGYAEQDAQEVFAIAKEVIREAAAQAGGEVAALSLSVQGDAVIPVDAAGRALSRAQLGMDYRAKDMLADLERKMPARTLFQKTGMRPHPLNAFLKMLWVKENDPALYARTHTFTTYADYILKLLGSDGFVIDRTMASRTMCMDVHTLEWSDEVLDVFGFDKAKLSKAVYSGEIVGEVPDAVAEELGLKKGCKLVAGGHDQTCAALGAGIVEPGLALDSHGTAEVISTAIDGVRMGDDMFTGYYPCYAHAAKGLYFTFALNHTGGILLKWFAENFCEGDGVRAQQAGRSVYTELCLHLDAEPSPVMLIPHLNGSGTPTCELSAKGTLLGLTLNTTRYDVAKAVLEALAFEMRLNMDALRQTGIDVRSLRCVGGGARSEFTLQNKADCMGVPVATLQTREAACLGAAMLAGIALGVYKNASDAVQAVVKTARVFEPDTRRARLYSERYAQYRAYEALSRNLYRC